MTNQLQHHYPQHQRRGADLRIPAIEKYAYCLCLHVKPTTIFIGVFKLIRALLFASILLNTEITLNEQVNDLGLTVDQRHKSTAIAVNILSRIITASVSAVGIYAVISGRAALLMPLYATLLVDFFYALPDFYNTDLEVPSSDVLSEMRPYSTASNNQFPFTRYSLMLFASIQMIVKVYFLCVVWKCYRYLRLIELVSPIRISEFYPHIHPAGGHFPIVRVLGSGDSADLSTGHNMVPPPYESIASNMKPPNYEEAMKSSSINFISNPMFNQQQQPVTLFVNSSSDDTHGPGVLTRVITDGSSSASFVPEENGSTNVVATISTATTTSTTASTRTPEQSNEPGALSCPSQNSNTNNTKSLISPDKVAPEMVNGVQGSSAETQVIVAQKSESNDTRDSH